MKFPVTRLPAAVFATLVAAILVTGQSPAPLAAAITAGPAARVVAAAQRHLGAPYQWGATGPSRFDCSGLVYRAFAEAGLLDRIGNGRYRDARSLYRYFASRGLASSSGGQIGDLVIYGGGSHVGIYLGNGRVISALVEGVRTHGLRALTTPFTAFLHTDLSGPAAATTTTGASGGSKAVSRAATAWLNVRAGPSTARTRLAMVAPGTRLTVLGSARDGQGRSWLDVRLSSGRVGWVAAWFTR